MAKQPPKESQDKKASLLSPITELKPQSRYVPPVLNTVLLSVRVITGVKSSQSSLLKGLSDLGAVRTSRVGEIEADDSTTQINVTIMERVNFIGVVGVTTLT